MTLEGVPLPPPEKWGAQLEGSLDFCDTLLNQPGPESQVAAFFPAPYRNKQRLDRSSWVPLAAPEATADVAARLLADRRVANITAPRHSRQVGLCGVVGLVETQFEVLQRDPLVFQDGCLPNPAQEGNGNHNYCRGGVGDSPKSSGVDGSYGHMRPGA